MDLLTITEAAKRLRQSERTVWRRIGEGRLIAVRLSRKATRVTEPSLAALIAAGTATPPQETK